MQMDFVVTFFGSPALGISHRRDSKSEKVTKELAKLKHTNHSLPRMPGISVLSSLWADRNADPFE